MVTFGGARSITQKYFAKATNYYARNDPILLVNRRAMALMQQVRAWVGVGVDCVCCSAIHVPPPPHTQTSQ